MVMFITNSDGHPKRFFTHNFFGKQKYEDVGFVGFTMEDEVVTPHVVVPLSEDEEES